MPHVIKTFVPSPSKSQEC